MKTVLVALLLSGCSQVPTFQYCEKVVYERNGSHFVVYAECDVKSGVTLPGL